MKIANPNGPKKTNSQNKTIRNPPYGFVFFPAWLFVGCYKHKMESVGSLSAKLVLWEKFAYQRRLKILLVLGLIKWSTVGCVVISVERR